MKLIVSREVVNRGDSGKSMRIIYDRKGRKVRTPWTKEGLLNWSQMREGLRDLMPSRKPATKLVFAGKCQRCGSRYEAESPRKEYCSKQCQSKAAVARWYPIRKQRGDFKRGRARTLQKKRQEAEARIDRQVWLEAKKLFREVVYENIGGIHYPSIIGQLGYRKGYEKIKIWRNKRLTFEQIPAEDRAVFIYNVNTNVRLRGLK